MFDGPNSVAFPFLLQCSRRLVPLEASSAAQPVYGKLSKMVETAWFSTSPHSHTHTLPKGATAADILPYQALSAILPAATRVSNFIYRVLSGFALTACSQALFGSRYDARTLTIANGRRLYPSLHSCQVQLATRHKLSTCDVHMEDRHCTSQRLVCSRFATSFQPSYGGCVCNFQYNRVAIRGDGTSLTSRNLGLNGARNTSSDGIVTLTCQC